MNDHREADALDDDDRALYAGLADILIPHAEGMPSASEADVPARWLAEALAVRPDLAPGLRVALSVAREQTPAAAIEVLHHEHPTAFEDLGTLSAGAYFMNPAVRALLGYPGQQPQPVIDDIDTYIELLERVVERGPLYREVSGAAATTPAPGSARRLAGTG